MSSLLLLLVLASTYTYIGVTLHHFATLSCASVRTLNELCWFIQGFLTLPWHILNATLNIVLEASQAMLCKVSKLLPWEFGLDEQVLEEYLGYITVIVPVMGAALWVPLPWVGYS